MLAASGQLAVSTSGAAEKAATAPARDGFITIDSLATLREFAGRSGVKVRLKPGTYTLDQASSRHFIALTGDDTHWDLRGVTLRIDTNLFRQIAASPGGSGSFYCAFSLTGNRITFEGLRTENFGDRPGLQSRNKIFDLTGSDIVLRDVDITTSGSSPWGHGSLFGISGGDVRKMNGIRVGWPARNVSLVGCRVHMRAMGHGIFVQGARDTLIQDCHVDGLLRSTNDILAEKSGYAFERAFMTRGHGYIEGVNVGADGRILHDEMIALSEDGIRLYEGAGKGQPTGPTRIVDCTVSRMRRGFCTGLSSSADTLVNCVARECVATGFNVGSRDGLQACRADARYSEALSLPYVNSHDATVELELLDSRGGLANDLLAVVNGRSHRITLRTPDPAFVPPGFAIELATHRGYAHYQKAEALARDIVLRLNTAAPVVQNPGAQRNEIVREDTDALSAPTR